MTEEILLSFSGPFRLSEIPNNVDSSLVNTGGIYLFTIEQNEIYYIYYVGQSYNMVNRNIQHKRDFTNKRWTLFKRETDKSGNLTGLEFAFIPGIDNFGEEESKLAQQNIHETWVFLGKFLNEHNYRYEAIEGAIQLYLLRKADTRKFMVTCVSEYTFRSFINYKFRDSNLKVFGLESSGIISLQSRAR